MKLLKLTTCTRALATMVPNARKAGAAMVCVSLGYGPEAKSRTRYTLSLTAAEATQLASHLQSAVRKLER